MYLQYGALCLTQVKLGFCLSSNFGLPQRLSELCCSFSQNGPVQKDVVVRCHGRGKCSITSVILCLLSPWAVTLLSSSQFIFGVTFKERHMDMQLNAFFNIHFIQTVVNCGNWSMVKEFLLCPKAPGMCLLFYYLQQKHEFVRGFFLSFLLWKTDNILKVKLLGNPNWWYSLLGLGHSVCNSETHTYWVLAIFFYLQISFSWTGNGFHGISALELPSLSAAGFLTISKLW